METSVKKGISIIVPFLNEEETIIIFSRTIDAYVEHLTFPVELVFVDDGSTDKTIDKITEYSFEHITSVKLVKLSKNFGSHAAIRAGLCHAMYDICTWLATDLQEPLEIIDRSFDEIEKEGFDAVYIEKKSVGTSKPERFFSKTYSWLMQKYAVRNFSSGGIATIVFNKKIKDFLNNNIESNSSILLQIIDAGFKYEVISMDYGKRVAGKSKWTFSKKIKILIDSFVAFSFAPIRLVSLIGGIMFITGFIIGIVTIINKICNPNVPVGYSTLASIMALGFGITNISLGIIAEYLWRTYDASRKRPVFIVADVIDVISN